MYTVDYKIRSFYMLKPELELIEMINYDQVSSGGH